jgi:hypothetical protein
VVALSLAATACGTSGDNMTTTAASTATGTRGAVPADTWLSLGKPASPGECRDTVARLTEAAPVAAKVDPVEFVRADRLPPLPVTTRNPAFPTGLNRYLSAESYLEGTPVPNPAVWSSAMAQDGFTVAEAIGYQAGADRYGAEALNFGSPEQALDFQRQTLTASCAHGVVQFVRRIDPVPSSVAFIRTDGTSPYRASMVIGASVVHLTICECVETLDPLELVSQWARNTAGEMAIPPA